MQVTVFARPVDVFDGAEQRLRILLVDRCQSHRGRILKPFRPADESGPVVVDQFLNLCGFEFNLGEIRGVMLHNVPMQGYSNDGMFNCNPKFFWLLSRSSRYRWLDMRVTFDVVTTSEVSVSVTVDDDARLPEIVDALREFADVNVERGMAILCAVGDNLRADARLRPYFDLAVDRFLTVPDPRLTVLQGTPRAFRAIRIQPTEPFS